VQDPQETRQPRALANPPVGIGATGHCGFPKKGWSATSKHCVHCI
jgi:hypothetical protein